MTERIKTAVVDASLQDGPDAKGRQWPDRYLGSIANMPLIAHVVHSLAADGIERIVIVSNAMNQQRLASALAPSADWGVNLYFVANDTGAPLVPQLRRAVSDDAVLVHAGDCLFPADLPRLRSRFCACGLDMALLTQSLTPHDDGGRSQPLRELPRENPPGTAFVVGSDIWPELETLGDDALNPKRIVECLAQAGRRIGATKARQSWCYERRADRLLVANQMLLDALPAGTAPVTADTCHIEGRVSQSPSATIARSRIRGPVLVGPGAVVEDSFIGPYTAIGPGAVVVGAHIEYTMVLADAQIRYPRYPLEASVIGERTVVSQSFSLPAGLHLDVGPDAQVILG